MSKNFSHHKLTIRLYEPNCLNKHQIINTKFQKMLLLVFGFWNFNPRFRETDSHILEFEFVFINYRVTIPFITHNSTFITFTYLYSHEFTYPCTILK